MSKLTVAGDPQKDAAAQNAQEGVITVNDLSLLTGIPTSQLTKFAKLGMLEYFGEYHGKRFYNFQTIVTWALGSNEETEARRAVQKGLETEMRIPNCPYSIEIKRAENNQVHQIQIFWKVAVATT